MTIGGYYNLPGGFDPEDQFVKLHKLHQFITTQTKGLKKNKGENICKFMGEALHTKGLEPKYYLEKSIDEYNIATVKFIGALAQTTLMKSRLAVNSRDWNALNRDFFTS